uniref:Protein FAM171A1-like isoform X1 n=2 Tax=Petromyzon marinus TaxID=7757 RepID=A0AAJ7TU89_PETMA|nr:protein FAM171A1-like isoform X1 [Petromyzon marinus]
MERRPPAHSCRHYGSRRGYGRRCAAAAACPRLRIKTMPPLLGTLLLLLALLPCVACASKGDKQSRGGDDVGEVALRVRVVDATTQRAVRRCAVEVLAGRQQGLASGVTGDGGTATLALPYRPGAPYLLAATHPGYVHNTVAWQPTKPPVFSSLSVQLLPELPASLTVYDDTIVMTGQTKSAAFQPSVQLPAAALELPGNATFRQLSAFLTVAVADWELRSFPHMLGVEANATGNGSHVELRPVSAARLRLATEEGAEVEAAGPVQLRLPLPPRSTLRELDTVPAWNYDRRVGAWREAGLGLVTRQGGDLAWCYSAPRLGYWAAAFPPQPPVGFLPGIMLHISNYHTMLLLAILGGMALILLGLFLVLICYCRRRCRKRRQQQQRRKLAASTALENSKKDQSTSMSHINLISAVHMETMSSAGETDVHTPMLKPGFAAQPRDFASSRGGGVAGDELPRHKVTRELSSRTRSTTCRDSTDTLPGSREKFHRSTDTLQLTPAHSELLLQKTPEKMGEAPFRHLHREEQYRRSTSSDQPSIDEHSAAGKVPQDHHHHQHHQRGPSLQRAELQEAIAADKKSADNLMSRSVDALARPVNLPGQVTGQLLCYSSVDQMNDPRYHKMMQHTLVIPAHYVQLQQQYMLNPSESEGSKQQHQSHSQHQQYQQHHQHHQHQMQQQQSQQQQQQMYPHPHHPLQQQQQQQQESPRTESDREESPHMAESISIPVTLSEAAMSKLNMEIQGLTEKHLLDLGDLKPMKHPRAWFISLDGRSNSTVRHSYIDLQRSERSGSQDASLDSGVDVGESSKPGRKISEEGRQRHQSCGIGGGGGGGGGATGLGGGVAGGTVYTRLLFAGDRSESETAVCTPEDSSLKPLLSGDSRREDTLALSPDDDDEDDDDDTDAQMPTEYLSHLQSPPEYHHGGGKGHGDYMVQTTEGEYGGERRKNSSSYGKEQPLGAEYANEPRPAKAEPQQAHPGVKHQAGEFSKLRRPTDFSGKMKRAPREQQPRSPDDGSEDDQGGDKKSPWQKREERPLMVFNLK